MPVVFLIFRGSVNGSSVGQIVYRIQRDIDLLKRTEIRLVLKFNTGRIFVALRN